MHCGIVDAWSAMLNRLSSIDWLLQHAEVLCKAEICNQRHPSLNNLCDSKSKADQILQSMAVTDNLSNCNIQIRRDQGCHRPIFGEGQLTVMT